MKNHISITQIGKHLRLSSATISRAINSETRHMVKKETLDLIDNFIQEHNFVPNRTARMLRKNQTNTIGVLINFDAKFFSSGYLNDILYGICSRVSQSQYDIKILPLSEMAPVSMENFMIQSAIDGLIVLDWHAHSLLASELKANGLDKKIIVANNFFKNMKANILYADNLHWGYKATEYLVKKGCQHIAHIKGSTEVPDAKNRFDGYSQALESYNISWQKSMVLDGSFDKQKAYWATELLIARHPDIDGIFCADDMSAIGVLDCLRNSGRKCPEDVKVIGFDGASIGEVISPALTTVTSKPNHLGTVLVDELIMLLKSEKAEYVQKQYDMSICERESA